MGQTKLRYSKGRLGSKIILSFGSLFPNQDASTSFAREHDTFSGQFQLAAVVSHCPKLVPSGPRGLGCRMNMVLHHVSHPPDALREVHRGPRVGGRFLLADLAAHEEESYRERLGDQWLGFKREDLQRWLDSAELDLVKVEELSFSENRPAVLLLSANRRK